MQVENPFERLKNQVIAKGLCTHCGTCIALAKGKLVFQESQKGPLPKLVDHADFPDDRLIFAACPGKGLNYCRLNRHVFGKMPGNMLLGSFKNLYIGYSRNDNIRENSASGGIISHTLIYLLENSIIDGAVIVRMRRDKPWLAEPFIATTPQEILDGAQSVYTPVAVNTILPEISTFPGKLAYVGTPDQVASVRYLQMQDYAPVQKIKYILGPYVGTLMYLEAVTSYLKSNQVHSLSDIRSLKYRDGEWPGHLAITLKDGRVLRAKKFYYNYLIPFYITNSSLLSVDFANELTDISVGDAWSPEFIRQGKGFSVVVSRSEKGAELLEKMQQNVQIDLVPISAQKAVTMHAHMLDFKKRGAFIRFRLCNMIGMKAPDFGYSPEEIPFKRILVEVFISLLFLVGRGKVARKTVELIPLKIIGPLFDRLRYKWKRISKPSKRKGLYVQKFIEHN